MDQQHGLGDEDDENNYESDDQESDNDRESTGSDDTQTSNESEEVEGYSFEDVQAILRYISECNKK